MPCALAGVWHMFMPSKAEVFLNSWEWITHCHLCQTNWEIEYLPWTGQPRKAWSISHVHLLEYCGMFFCLSRLRSSWILGSALLIATFANKIESERLTLAMNRSASKGLKYMPWTLAGVWHMFLPFEAKVLMDSWEWITHCHLYQIKLRDWYLPWTCQPWRAWNICHEQSLVYGICFCLSRLRSSWILESESLTATFAK